SLKEVMRAAIFPRGTKFFSEDLITRGTMNGTSRQLRDGRRDAWARRALAVTAQCDFVFADPDNGLQCNSVKQCDKLGPKYAFYQELLPIIDRGQTLVVYHHTSRQGSADSQIIGRLREFSSLRPGIPNSFALKFRRGNSRAFVIVPSASQRDL